MKKAAKKKKRFQIYCEICLKIIFTFSLDSTNHFSLAFLLRQKDFPEKKIMPFAMCLYSILHKVCSSWDPSVL